VAARRASKSILLLLSVLLPVLLACAGLRDRIGIAILKEDLVLNFERGADLLPPEGLRATSTADRSIALAWDPVLVGDVAGYAITRAAQPDAPYLLVGQTYSRFGTVFTDRGTGPQRLGDGKPYHYRVHPYDRQGRVSRSHAYMLAGTDPRPAVPRALRAYSNLPRRVVLAWEPNDDPSVDGYVVERSPTVAGPWEAVGGSGGRLHTVYEDPVPGDLRVMYYRAIAKNRYGGQSDYTEPVRAVTKAEPLPPIGLAVQERALGRVELAWERNVEPDLVGYEIWRRPVEKGRKTVLQKLATVNGDATAFSDAGVACGARVLYRVRAVDDDGLVSSFSGPLEVDTIGLDFRLEAPRTLVWSVERLPQPARLRLVRTRRWLPDQGLLIEPGATRVSLAGLPAGRQRLVLTVEPAATPAARPIRCELALALPTSGS
jgi:hypothetical protein